jgi:hypothetical protein
MRFVRTLMALMIAASLAVQPIAGAGAMGLKSSEPAASSEMAASDGMVAAMDDCCPDPGKPCQGGDDCQSMATCAYQFSSISNVEFSRFEYMSVADAQPPILRDHAVALYDCSPPFRPSRV